jgi:hypothetical protein
MNPIDTHLHLEDDDDDDALAVQQQEPAKVSPTSAASSAAPEDDVDIHSTACSTSTSRGIIMDGNLPISPISITDANISENDVLFGRGGGTNRHVGNIYFRDLVSEHQPAYVQARKRDKTRIAKSIVAQVRNRNGRFLRKENGKWIDVGDKKAAEKTSQALREGLSGRMREIVKEGGVGLQKLKKIGFSLYEDNITREDVQRRLKREKDDDDSTNEEDHVEKKTKKI